MSKTRPTLEKLGQLNFVAPTARVNPLMCVPILDDDVGEGPSKTTKRGDRVSNSIKSSKKST